MRRLLVATTIVLTAGGCGGVAAGTDDDARRVALDAAEGAVEGGAGSVEPCDQLVALVGDLAALPDDGASLVAALETAARGFVPAATALGSDDGSAVATLLWELTGASRRLVEARPVASPTEAVLVDELIAVMPAFVQWVVVAGLPTMMPDSAACPLPEVSLPLSVTRFPTLVEEFASTDLGSDPDFGLFVAIADGMADGVERASDGAASVHVAAYDDCRRDLTALAVGDAKSCDVLAAACRAHDDLACNDLYWISIPGSEYEAIAASCGGTAELGDDRFAGFCDEPAG